jgi:ribosomal protein S27E
LGKSKSITGVVIDIKCEFCNKSGTWRKETSKVLCEDCYKNIDNPEYLKAKTDDTFNQLKSATIIKPKSGESQIKPLSKKLRKHYENMEVISKIEFAEEEKRRKEVKNGRLQENSSNRD